MPASRMVSNIMLLLHFNVEQARRITYKRFVNLVSVHHENNAMPEPEQNDQKLGMSIDDLFVYANKMKKGK